jgi:hypothetical protein
MKTTGKHNICNSAQLKTGKYRREMGVKAI